MVLGAGLGRSDQNWVSMYHVAADSYPDLLERLFSAYEKVHTFTAIEDVAARCQRDLAGQTSPGAQLELLERLARQRLTDMSPTRHGLA